MHFGADYGWKTGRHWAVPRCRRHHGYDGAPRAQRSLLGTDTEGRQLPYLDEVTIRVIRDETVPAAALRTGEIDLAYLPYKDVAAFCAPNVTQQPLRVATAARQRRQWGWGAKDPPNSIPRASSDAGPL